MKIRCWRLCPISSRFCRMNEPSEDCLVGLGVRTDRHTTSGRSGQLRLVRATIYAATYRRVSTEVLLDPAPPSILDRGAPMDDACN